MAERTEQKGTYLSPRFQTEAGTLSAVDAFTLTQTILSFSRGNDFNTHIFTELFRRHAAPMQMHTRKETVPMVIAETQRRIGKGRHTHVTDLAYIAAKNVQYIEDGVNGAKSAELYMGLPNAVLYALVAASCIDRDYHFGPEAKQLHDQSFTPMPPTKIIDTLLSATPKKTAIPQFNEGMTQVANYMQTVSRDQFMKNLSTFRDLPLHVSSFYIQHETNTPKGILTMLSRLVNDAQKEGKSFILPLCLVRGN